MIKALGNFIIIKPFIQEKIECYEVISVSPMVTSVKEGDFVYVYDFGLEEFLFEGKPLFVVEIHRVYAKK